MQNKVLGMVGLFALMLFIGGATDAMAQPGGGGANIMQRMDANGDGAISQEEFRGPANTFSQLDANGDGKIEEAEFTAGMAQMRGNRGQGGQGGRGGQGGQGGFGNFQQRRMDQLKTELGVSDQQWTVLEPRIAKVTETEQAVTAFGRGGRGGRGGFGGGRGGRGGPGAQATPNPAIEGLNQAVQNENSSPEQLQAALKAYRDARAAAQKAVDDARTELKKLLSVRQEAVLVINGILE